MFNDTQPGGAIDSPDENDYWASHVLGADDSNLPDSVKMKTVADNQGLSSETKVACTAYTAYHVAKILNEIEHRKELTGLPTVGWKLQKKFGTSSKNGDYVQTALKSIVKNGFHEKDKIYGIFEYARIKPTELKSWLARGFPVYTSSIVTKTNFIKAKKDGIWGGNDGPVKTGHAWAIIGYDKDEHYWALNSYGPDWGKFKDGTFKVLPKDIGSVGSMYIVYDKKDSKNIFRDVTTESPFAEDIEWALEEGLMLGYDSESLPAEKRFFKPEQGVTRAEMAAILHRFKQKYL